MLSTGYVNLVINKAASPSRCVERGRAGSAGRVSRWSLSPRARSGLCDPREGVNATGTEPQCLVR